MITTIRYLVSVLILTTLFLCAPLAAADSVFVEAEWFEPSSAGWKVSQRSEVAKASRATTLWGADGPGDATASKAVTLKTAGKYRVWVRYLQVGAWRGPFRLAAVVSGKEVGGKNFDLE